MDVSKDMHASGMISLNSMDLTRKSKIESRAVGAGDRSKQANKVAWEYVSPGLSPRLIQELAAPPAVLGSRRYSHDIARLEFKFFLDRCVVIVQRFY